MKTIKLYLWLLCVLTSRPYYKKPLMYRYCMILGLTLLVSATVSIKPFLQTANLPSDPVPFSYSEETPGYPTTPWELANLKSSSGTASSPSLGPLKSDKRCHHGQRFHLSTFDMVWPQKKSLEPQSILGGPQPYHYLQLARMIKEPLATQSHLCQDLGPEQPWPP